MTTSTRSKVILISGLVIALGLPGLASADSNTRHSLKYQARESVEQHDRGQQRYSGNRHRGDDRQQGHRNRQHSRHGNNRDHRHYGHYGRYTTQHYRRDHGHGYHHADIHFGYAYATPHLGLSIYLGD